jgi:hypothetical protein
MRLKNEDQHLKKVFKHELKINNASLRKQVKLKKIIKKRLQARSLQKRSET